MHHCLGEIDFNRSFESCDALSIHDFLVPDNVSQFHSFNFNPQIEFFVTPGGSEFSCRELPLIEPHVYRPNGGFPNLV